MTELAKYADEIVGLHLTQTQLDALGYYEQALLDWNTRINLTAIDHPEQIRVKHFLDSLTCLLAMRGTPVERVVDVGTGAGFPGIPLKIVCPNMRLSLLESTRKKADFCRHAVQTLQLSQVEVVQERAEIVGWQPAHRERYDWALARAVAGLPVLIEYLLPLVHVGGKALAMKGENGPAEAQSAERAMRLLGGQLSQIIPVTLPGVGEQRYLIVIEKIAATPNQYPRRVGLPAKRPL